MRPPEVREEKRRNQAKYRKRLALNGGKPLTISPEFAARHLARLRAEGVGLRTVSDATGVDRRSLQRILQGEYKTISIDTHRRILGAAVRPHLVSATPTHRRIQALAAIGYSFSKLEAIRGKTGIWWLLRRASVEPQVAREWAELYDRLCMTPPVGVSRSDKAGITRAKRVAEQNGWVPPLGWDDIDDPTEKPKHQLTKHQAQHQRRYARGQKRWTA